MSLSREESERRGRREVEIAERVRSGESPKTLAKEYDMCFEHIQRICKSLHVEWSGYKPHRKKSMSLEETVKWAESQSVRNERGCLIWTGHKRGGYGRIKFKGKLVGLHRLVAEYYSGRPLDQSEEACHRCDDPSCISGSCVFIASHAENMKDRDAKGRNINYRGEQNGASRLKRREVQEVKFILNTTTMTCADIGALYGVHPTTINLIKKSHNWPEVPALQ